jgi:hypothetical protein
MANRREFLWKAAATVGFGERFRAAQRPAAMPPPRAAAPMNGNRTFNMGATRDIPSAADLTARLWKECIDAA